MRGSLLCPVFLWSTVKTCLPTDIKLENLTVVYSIINPITSKKIILINLLTIEVLKSFLNIIPFHHVIVKSLIL